MSYNLAELSKDMDKVNVDLAASGVALKECYNMPVIPDVVEREQPAYLYGYFRERVAYYRIESHKFSRLMSQNPNDKKTHRSGGLVGHSTANRSISRTICVQLPG